MIYIRRAIFFRAAHAQKLKARYYEPCNQSKCLKMIWRRYHFPFTGDCYQTFRRLLKIEVPPEIWDIVGRE